MRLNFFCESCRSVCQIPEDPIMMNPMADLFASPGGSFRLSRFPSGGKSSLQAWDAADEYILTEAFSGPGSPDPVLILNDQWGGLTCPLTARALAAAAGSGESAWMSADLPICHTDSFLSARGIRENCRENRLPEPRFIEFGESFPPEARTVCLKIPGQLDYFEDLLSRLCGDLPPGTPVIAGGLGRNLPPRFFQTFARYTREAESSLLRKRARIFRGRLDREDLPPAPEPAELTVPRLNLALRDLPGVFSRGRLDPGTRLLLETLPGPFRPQRVGDPGCGGGILGLAAARLWPEARITGTDDSARAVASAEENFRLNGLEGREELMWTHILEGVPGGTLDLVLCNPPFHRGGAVSVETGLEFIRDCARALAPEGDLLLVANRHLGYRNTMLRFFKEAEIVKENDKYRVYRCRGKKED